MTLKFFRFFLDCTGLWFERDCNGDSEAIEHVEWLARPKQYWAITLRRPHPAYKKARLREKRANL